MTKSLKVLALASVMLFATPALAQTPAVTVTGTPSPVFNGPFTLGYEFSTSRVFSVTGLGVFDADGDGFGESHDVGLWNASGTLLASTTLAQGTSGTLISGFRFASVTPLTLGIGTYRVGALFGATPIDPLFFPGDGVVTAAPGVTYLSGAFIGGGTLADPIITGGASPSYIGGNVLFGAFGAVPEPATWAMMIIGFGAVGGAMRRRSAVRTTVRFA